MSDHDTSSHVSSDADILEPASHNSEQTSQMSADTSVEAASITSTNAPLAASLTGAAAKCEALTKPNYGNDTPLFLSSMMNKTGYGGRKQRKENLKDVFPEAEKLSEQSHGIKRRAKGWQNQFTPIEQECPSFISKLQQSSSDGDDEALINKSEYLAEMDELEHGKARHEFAAQYTTDEDSSAPEVLAWSTRKRAKISRNERVWEVMWKQRESIALLVSVLQRMIEERKEDALSFETPR